MRGINDMGPERKLLVGTLLVVGLATFLGQGNTQASIYAQSPGADNMKNSFLEFADKTKMEMTKNALNNLNNMPAEVKDVFKEINEDIYKLAPDELKPLYDPKYLDEENLHILLELINSKDFDPSAIEKFEEELMKNHHLVGKIKSILTNPYIDALVENPYSFKVSGEAFDQTLNEIEGKATQVELNNNGDVAVKTTGPSQPNPSTQTQ